MTAPRRRWFRFSLLVLLTMVSIAGVATVWVKRNLNWMHRRQQFAENAVLAPFVAGKTLPKPTYRMVAEKPAPWPLRWFGDVGYTEVYVNLGAVNDWSETDRIHDLFPEAGMVISGWPPGWPRQPEANPPDQP